MNAANHRLPKFFLGTGTLAAVGAADYLTGYDLQFFLFYFAPVAMVAWRSGRAAGLFMAVAAAIVWLLMDILVGHSYSSLLVQAWNSALRLIAFLTIAWLVAEVRARELAQQQLNAELRQTVARLEEAAATARRLREEIQVVCAWTKRIKADGRWMQFEEFLQRNFQMRISHGISEEAMADVKRELEAQRIEPRAES